jgi:hypothetical protein
VITLPNSPEVNAAVGALMSAAGHDQTGSAALYLLGVHRRVVEGQLNQASRAALFTDEAKANALRLLGKLEAYDELASFINNLKT